MAVASDDEKLSELISKHGAEGYGIYWLILERIADKMEKGSNKTSCRYPAKKWAEICGKNQRGMRNIYQTLEYLSLFIFKRYGKHMDILDQTYQYEFENNCVTYEYYINIDCPNLLKYRDEYSKKSGQCPDCVPTMSGQESATCQEQDTETETDIEINTNTAFSNAVDKNEKDEVPEEKFYSTKRKRKLMGKRLESFDRFWEDFNYKKGRAEAADSWLDIPELTNSLVETICSAARKEAMKRKGLISKGTTPKMAQGWLTARRWEDEENVTSQKTEADLTNKAILKALETENKYAIRQ